MSVSHGGTAVVLARGLGSRMRKAEVEDTGLSIVQQQAASGGAKAMMPIRDAHDRERPFLDWILSGLADAGIDDVILVVAPDHAVLRGYFEGVGRPRRVRVRFAVQEEPIGTANAVLAAEAMVPPRFLVMNGDNLYPTDAISRLREGIGVECIAFDGRALVERGNIPPQRLRAFARLDVRNDGLLRGLEEKPSEADIDRLDWPVSMNLWAFDASIFAACRSVPRSRRGEYELPEAVDHGVRSGTLRVRALPVAAPVWDLSARGDVSTIARVLRELPVDP
jgi:dTDP-glucose pyrophosphorylase